MQISRYLVFLSISLSPSFAAGQASGIISDAQSQMLRDCTEQIDNLQRLLCYDLVMGEDTLEQALVPTIPKTPLSLEDYALPSLAPVLNLLEDNRKAGETDWQFAISGDRENEFLLLNVLYGPSLLFDRYSSIYWPQPAAVLQTGIEVFASQRGRLNSDAFLFASCQQEFPTLRLALDRPLFQENYEVTEVYPDGTRRQGTWRTVDAGLVLEMARGIPAFEAMNHMSVDGIVNFSLLDGQDLHIFEFDTQNFIDIATSVGLSCNIDLVKPTLDSVGEVIEIPLTQSDVPTNN